MRKLALLLIITATRPSLAVFGEENFALAKLVAGQVQEISKLAEIVGASKDNLRALEQINSGINRVTSTIATLEEIKRRAQGLDPRSARRASDLSKLIQELTQLRDDVRGITTIRLALVGESIDQASMQTETTYLMGQEMIKVGSNLSSEAHSASPGRAAQISAAANSSAMLSEGVQLQTLAHIAQLQAMSLELQKSQLESELHASDERQRLYQARLVRPSTPRPLASNP